MKRIDMDNMKVVFRDDRYILMILIFIQFFAST